MTPEEQISSLRATLHRHNYNYYVKHNPEISDFEFDKLLKQLQDLEQNILNSTIQLRPHYVLEAI